MTIREALQVNDRSISGRDAEIFLQYAINQSLSYLLAHGEIVLTAAQQAQFEGYITKREQNQPVAYIVGQKEFYGRPFKTDKRALIPRPETEGLIDKALSFLPEHFKALTISTNKPCPIHILELGTGCGNIAVTLALELEKRAVPAHIIATDVVPEPLALAQENFDLLSLGQELTKITFLVADLFDALSIRSQAPFDLIIANLPYVPTTWKIDPLAQPEVVFQEPDIALFGGEDGMDIYRMFFVEAPQYLAPDGRILIEYGEDETPALTNIATTAFPDRTITTYQDYAGLDRILEIV
jgi:release factor glutamine methyltransferase